ncbi:MAG: class I SAM-dependent methyltransferase [Patescibacteria group bacterium]
MSDYKTITQQAYDGMADAYAERDSEIIEETFEVKSALDHFISLLPPGGHVLDIGSGGGRDSIYMFSKRLEVTGVDLSENMIRNAKERTPGITYLQMDFEELDFANDMFDGIWANASLHHVPKEKLAPVLVRIHRLLKAGGLFYSINKQGEFDGIRENNKFGKAVRRHFSFYKPEELTGLVKDAGFTIEEVNSSTSDEWVNVLARK